MLCPVCSIELYMSERQGIEIDYCPQCRGVWLDRGELDKIIERSNPTDSEKYEHDNYRDDDSDSRDGYKQKAKRKPEYKKKPQLKSFLGELFDFD